MNEIKPHVYGMDFKNFYLVLHNELKHLSIQSVINVCTLLSSLQESWVGISGKRFLISVYSIMKTSWEAKFSIYKVWSVLKDDFPFLVDQLLLDRESCYLKLSSLRIH